MNSSPTQLIALILLALSLTSPVAAQAAADVSSATAEVDEGSVPVEEQAALERATESRVREILGGIIRSDEYAVYVRLALKNDSKAIKAYYDEVSLTNLPGIPASDPSVGSPANNRLHSLVQSQKVIVVLDKSVTGDQELVAKEVLASKLGIDAKRGDALEFRRSEVPAAAERALASASQGGEAQPWIKKAIIALALLLAIATAVLLWQLSLLRERVNSRAKLNADIKVEQPPMAPPVAAATPPAADPEAEAEGDAKETTAAAAPLKVSVAEMKEKILSLAVSHPKACSRVARKLFSTRDGTHKLAIVSDVIGFEYMRQLFDGVSPDRWRLMGEHLRENLDSITRTPAGPVLLQVYTDFLAESMAGDNDAASSDPFQFLYKLREPELRGLIADEDPSHVAFIAAYREPEEMTQLLAFMPDDKRRETVLQIARLRTLPKEVVEDAGRKFAERLKAIRGRNELSVNGSQVVAKVLGSLDGAVEEEILNYIESHDPETRERLRAHYFTFDSVDRVPADVLTAVFERDVDAETITRSLVGATASVAGAILGILPSKQRSMIEDDLSIANSQNSIPRNKVADARKLLVALIQKELKERGIAFESLPRAGGSGPVAGEATVTDIKAPAAADGDAGSQSSAA